MKIENSRMSLKQIVEALVFASQKPLLPREIVAALKAVAKDGGEESDDFGRVKESEIAALLEELKIEAIEAQRAFQLVEQVNGWHFVTDPQFGRWVRQLYPEAKPARLSGPALETLAIIAYRQPITRADIESVRGVAVDGMVNALLERGLIRIAGRSEAPGRPLLYETTQFFLEHFGLKTLEELPNATELRRLNLPAATSPEPAQTEFAPEAESPAEPAPEQVSEEALSAIRNPHSAIE